MKLRTFATTAAMLPVLALSLAVPASAQTGQVAVRGDTEPQLIGAGHLRDLQPDTANPTDGASAALLAATHEGSTRFHLLVDDLDRSSVGHTFGVHAHVGPCVAGNGDAAGPHYNTGGPPSPNTEVWLDFTVRQGGVAWSHTTTPFVIPEGEAQSIVVHENPTDETGDAGDRIACLPVHF